MPRVFARGAARTGAPVAAILVTAAAALAASVLLDFDRLIDFGNVVIGAQYLATCASVLSDRRLGAAIPLAGIAATLWLSAQGGWGQIAAAGACLGVGLLLRAALRTIDGLKRIG